MTSLSPAQKEELRRERLPPTYRTAFSFHALHDSGLPPRSVVELAMIAASQAIRRKPDWQSKLDRPEVVERWRSELSEQGLAESSIAYVVAELRWYATLLPAPLQPGAVEGTYEAEGLVLDTVAAALASGVERLRAEGPPDWHPGSAQLVRDLVHPSLYCGVRGVSLLRDGTTWPVLTQAGSAASEPSAWQPWPRGKDALDLSVVSWADPHFRSPIYQWLPAEVDLDAAGNAHFASYINNLCCDAAHAGLYDALGATLSAFLPLFERVLADLKAPRPKRIKMDSIEPPEPPEGMDEEEVWNLPMMLPAPAPEFSLPPSPTAMLPPYATLRGKRLQVIVKIADIVLTPEAPEYPGGVWHIEGMANERIVATGIYYAVVDNISESLLHFRAAVEDPAYEQGDGAGCEAVYGLDGNVALNQPLGYIVVRQGKAIAFPNLYQHKVGPFSLIDRTRPGMRSIVVFFLVDPGVRVTSTEDIPPQQAGWAASSPPFAAAAGSSSEVTSSSSTAPAPSSAAPTAPGSAAAASNEPVPFQALPAVLSDLITEYAAVMSPCAGGGASSRADEGARGHRGRHGRGV